MTTFVKKRPLLQKLTFFLQTLVQFMVNNYDFKSTRKLFINFNAD